MRFKKKLVLDFFALFQLFVSIFTFLIVTVAINWLAVVAVFPLLLFFAWLRQYYIRTSRNVKRLEAACE